MRNASSPASAGDHAPPFYGMTADRRFWSAEDQYGRPAVLLLAGARAVGGLTPLILDFASRQGAFTGRNADVWLVVDDNPASLWPHEPAPIRIIDCGRLLLDCGVGAEDALLLVLDRNLRVALRHHPRAGEDGVAACLDCLDALPGEAPMDVTQPAPAIVLPNLLPRSVCQALVDRFESSPTIDGEIARIDAAGVPHSVVDHAKKSRRDMPIAPDDDRHGGLRDLLLARCAPEILKAFQGRVTHIDRLLVSRYDAGAGWFRRHRDNTAANVAFREFALSLNLNAENYAGGHLWFPEYNDHRYKPPTGAGVIFSAAVLHEATAVTAGSRYVLLTFFHSDAAEARRCACADRA